MTKQSAHALYKRALKLTPKADVEEMRKLEAERIADLRRRIWSRLAGRPDPRPVMPPRIGRVVRRRTASQCLASPLRTSRRLIRTSPAHQWLPAVGTPLSEIFYPRLYDLEPGRLFSFSSQPVSLFRINSIAILASYRNYGSDGVLGRDRIRGRPDRHFLRQNSSKPWRCQPIKVLGVTRVRALRQSNRRLSHRRVKRVGWEIRRGLMLRSW